MSPLAARFDRFVRWFFNSSPSAEINAREYVIAGAAESRDSDVRASKPAACGRGLRDRVYS